MTNPVHSLAQYAGTWRGTNVLQDPETNTPEESPSTLVLAPILDHRFIRVEYRWQYRGSPQEGLFLIGYEVDVQTVNVYWADTWHMGDKVMACRGSAQAGGIEALGSYSAGDGPAWGWRITLQPVGETTLRLWMVNIALDGEVYPAVEAEYQRG